MTNPALTNPAFNVDGAELRAWTVLDAPRLVEAWTDPDIAAWNGVPANPKLDDAVKWINGVQARLARRLSLDWVIDSTVYGAVGEVGLSGFSNDHAGALIGYWLLPRGRGQGLAATSVQVCTDWAHQTLALDVIVARCDPANVASHAVVAAAGYALEAIDEAGNQIWRSHAG